MGPGVGLLLFDRRTMPEVRTAVLPWMETFTDDAVVGPDGAVEFHVRESAVAAIDLDGAQEWSGGPFCLDPGDDYWYEDEYELLPRRPEQALVLWAGVNNRADHFLLGTLALGFARRLDAYISYDGDLGPEVREAQATLPGRLWDLEGEHVADVGFHSAWLHHPDFHLLK